MSRRRVRVAMVVERTLGHATHYENLRAAAIDHDTVDVTWIPIDFAPQGIERVLPVVAGNWSARASLRARYLLAGRADSYDALFFHTQVTSLLSVGLMRRVPTALSLDATPINYDSVGHAYGHRPAGQGWLDLRKHDLNRRAFHGAAAIVSWSEWARRSLVDDYGIDPARVSVLAPGAADPFFVIGRRRLSRAPAADSPVRILFVGGDFARKGGPELLAAFRELAPARCELDVVTRDLVEAVPGVRVHRATSNSPELLQLFERADIFALPSHGECLSVALMEAAAAGLPIVTTDVGALAEAVLAGETGLVVRAGAMRELRYALESLASDAGARRRMGRAAAERARKVFDARANDLALLDLLSELGARGARDRAA